MPGGGLPGRQQPPAGPGHETRPWTPHGPGPGAPAPGQPPWARQPQFHQQQPFQPGPPFAPPLPPAPSRRSALPWVLGGLGAVLVLALAGLAVVLAARPTPLPSPPVSAPTGIPAPTTPDAAAEEGRLAAVTLTTGEVGLPVVEAGRFGNEGGALINCREQLPSDSAVALIHERHWRDPTATPITVIHHVLAYDGPRGAEAVEQARSTFLSACQRYVASTGRAWVVDSQPQLPAVQGVEAQWAVCTRIDDPQYVGATCTAYLARGDVVSVLTVSVGTNDPTQTKDVFDQLTPAAARLLAKS